MDHDRHLDGDTGAWEPQTEAEKALVGIMRPLLMLRGHPMLSDALNVTKAKIVIETALICTDRPLQLSELCDMFEGQIGPDTIRHLLDELVKDWEGRGAEIATIAGGGWRLQSRPEMAAVLRKVTHERQPRYSRAALETLAVIAYRQPVTRADIEEVRGVGVSSAILKQFEDRGWVEVVGQRDAPGRPALYATTTKFLDDMGAPSLEALSLGDIDEPEHAAGLESAGLPPMEEDTQGSDSEPTQAGLPGLDDPASQGVPTDSSAHPEDTDQAQAGLPRLDDDA